MNWDKSSNTNGDTDPVDDLGSVENALRHELSGTFVPFDGARAEEMIEAATRAEVSRLPRMAAPLGTAAAVLAVGAGVAVFAANGSGDNAAPAGGARPSPKPTTHVSCLAVPMRTAAPKRLPMPTVLRMPTVVRSGVYHGRGPAPRPTLPPPGHIHEILGPYHSRLTCSAGRVGTVPCRKPLPLRLNRHPLKRGTVICSISSRSARVRVPPLTTRPAPPPAPRSVSTTFVQPPRKSAAHRLTVPPPPGPVTASGSPAAS